MDVESLYKLRLFGTISNNTGSIGINTTPVEMMIRILMITAQISLIQFNGLYINS